ncbi:hypothetical protein [Gimesia aquarii]|uniref:Uncharacterized protein n=1 Tax=Gimesia aquarii TaxID=2527964 RepID=A0A517VVI5_9PLAN|nr:hypothetical protein [Gimesia aquarii]QDT97016.1 hypothetical protein V144x_24870 [Gimesia aquarii]
MIQVKTVPNKIDDSQTSDFAGIKTNVKDPFLRRKIVYKESVHSDPTTNWMTQYAIVAGLLPIEELILQSSYKQNLM